MRSTGLLLVVALSAAITLACGNNRDANTTTTAEAPAIGTGGEIRNDDTPSRGLENWTGEVAEHNMAEIELGKLAAERASNAEVKQFGQMMVQDHTMAGNELKQAIAGRIQIQERLSDDHRDLSERLSKLQGAEFDREFMNAMVDGHEEVKDLLEERANDTSDDPVETAVNQWATKTLPNVEKHLQQAMQIRDKVQDRRNTTN